MFQFVSIVIATFNSSRVLPLVLNSIRNQTYPQDQLEILLLDGGSEDDTREIGTQYKCSVVDNPKTDPISAKELGLSIAKGKYIVFLDHDEILESPTSIEAKVALMEIRKQVKLVLTSGFKTPTEFHNINNYINEFGDPFSFFIYRFSALSGRFVNELCDSLDIIDESDDSFVFRFSLDRKLPIFECAAGGVMIERDYLIANYSSELKTPGAIGHLFYLLMSKLPFFGVLKADPILHYSSENLTKYLSKIRWRIKNNIFHMAGLGAAGFAGREKYHAKANYYKKYLFIPYSLSLFAPLADSIWLVASRRNISYLWHFPLCIYTASWILFYWVLKIMGYHPPLRSYDEVKIIR